MKLDDPTRNLEDWLRTEGVARYDAYKRDPTGELAQIVFTRLREHYAIRAISAGEKRRS